MIVTWLTFAPTQAGGMASYIIVIGNSMEPGFHIGDLIITHKDTAYQVGDAVVYRNLELGNFVFHRIVSQEADRYALKGDNNSWVDTYQPARAEIVGKLWLRVPRGGVYVQKIRNPFVMALIAGALGGALTVGVIKGKSRGKKHMANQSIQKQFDSIKQKARNWFTAPGRHDPGAVQGNLLEGFFFALGALALVSLILGIVAFSRPASRMTKDDVHFEHVGFFSYSATAPQGVYDSNAIQSGDPIFPILTCSVDVSFQYTFIAQGNAKIAGTHQLTAVISEPVSGWQRRVALEEETTFTGNAFGASTKLNLCQMEKLTQSMEAGTDFHPGTYILSVVPNVKLTGDVSGRALESGFNPSLTFQYDRVHFYVVEENEQGNALNPTQAGILSENYRTANTILLFDAELAVPALRWFAAIGLIGSLAGILSLGMRLQSLSQSDRGRFIRMRYDAILVNIQNADAFDPSSLVDVASIEDLAKLAERFNAMILHTENGNSLAYYVRGEGCTYRFVLPVETGPNVPMKEAKS